MQQLYTHPQLYKKNIQPSYDVELSYQDILKKYNANELYSIALQYEQSNSTLHKAATYYKLAICSGNIHSLNNLGVLFATLDPHLDYASSIYYLSQGERSHDPLCSVNLGIIYGFKLSKTNTHLQQARKYLERARLSNTASITTILGNINLETSFK